jgi:endonuclease/exonuclease/phosphatase family metal-dependent hydrolase
MLRSLSLALALAIVAGCIVDDRDPGSDAGPEPPDTGFPEPRTDLFPPIGDETTLDVATWNIENFPASRSTPETVADFVASMDLDLLAVQEITDEAAWEELLDRLPDHDGVLSNHSYSDGSFQRVGFVYKESVLEVSDVTVLFSGSGFEFPRPPVSATFTAVDRDFDFTAITVHLKAGGGFEDRERRTEAVIRLESHIRSLVDGLADDDVILLGDFNDVLTEASGREVFAPLLNSPARYSVLSEDIPASTASFIPSSRTLDHIIVTASLNDEVAGRDAEVAELDRAIGSFEATVSDHLPVVLSFPF